MAADERAVITIDVDVKNLNRIQQVTAALEEMGIASEVNAAKFDGLVGAMGRQSVASNKASKSSQQLYERLTMVDRAAMAFTKQARKLMMGVIAMSVEFGVSALALASVNAAFVIGKVAAKGFQLVMQGVSAAVAAFGVAAVAAAAAFDEFQTAQFAFRYQSDAVTSSLDKSSFAMRSLYKDTQLNIYGIKALSAAFAAVSKNSKFTGESQKMLQAFSDFAASSGDPTKGLQAAANAIGLIQKKQVGAYKNSKYLSQEALNAIKQINPALADLYKTGAGKGNLTNKDKFIEMLLSGELAQQAGVAGAADNIAGTLFAQFKSYLASGLVELSDVGKRVLNPIKEALHEIFTGLIRTFRRVSGDIVSFGQGPFIKTVVGLVNKLEDFTVHLFRKYLPTTTGFMQRMGNVFTQLKIWFKDVTSSLNEMRAGGSVIIRTFGGAILEIFKGIGRNARSLSEVAVKNKDKFEAFGEALKVVVRAFFDMSAAFRNMFTQALPFINIVLKAVAKVMNAIEMIFTKVASFGSIGAALGVGFAGAAIKKGTRAARRKGGGGAKGDLYGYTQISEAEAARRNLTTHVLGGAGGGTGGSPLSGAMATAGTSVATAMTTALEPGFRAVSTSSNNAAAAFREVAGAVAAFGASLRGGATGGTVNWTGEAMREPRRKPGQTRAQYIRDITRWRMANRGDDLRGLEYTGPLGSASRRASSDPYAYGGLPGPYIPGLQKEQYIRDSRRARFEQNKYAIADKFAERLGYDTTAASYMEHKTAAKIAEESNAASRLTFGQRLKSMYRSSAVPNFLYGPGYASGGITGAMPGGGGGGGGVTIATDSKLPPGSIRSMGLLPFARRKAGQLAFGSGYEGRPVRAEFKNWLQGRSMSSGYQGSISQQMAQYEAKTGTTEGFKANRKAAFKAGLKQNFGGVGIAASIGAGYLANRYGSEEAQGALQAGAGLMSINPALGVGVAGLGTAYKAKTRLGGAAAGAVGGAALGAKIGQSLEIPFAGLIGAGLGALVGGVGGIIMASRNQRKMAEAAADKVNNAQLAGIAAAAIQDTMTGGFTRARQKMAQQSAFIKQFKAATTNEGRQALLRQYSTGPNAILAGNELSLSTGKNADDFIKQLEKQQKNQRGVTAAMEFAEKTMSRLKQTTGMTSAEIQELAMEKNVNLFDSTQSLNDITAKLGVGMVKTGKQMSDAFRDIRIAAMDVFNNFSKGKEMKDALQAAFETVYSGNATPEAFADYLNKYGDYLDYKNPNSPLMNIVATIKDFGSGRLFGQGGKFGAGGTLEGKTLGGETLKLGQESSSQVVSQASMQIADQIGSQLLATNVQGMDPVALRKRLIEQSQGLLETVNRGSAIGATPEQQTAAKAAQTQLKAIEQLIMNPMSFQGLNAADAQAKLEKYFPGLFGAPAAGETSARNRGQMGGLTDIANREYKLTVDEENVRDAFYQAVKSGFLDMKNMPEWWNQAPTWWNYKFNPDSGKFEPEDTRSPRRGRIGDTGTSRALGRTMAAHRSMDSMLTGKRTVTSSFRTTNLGSPSSDHAAGRAYDLTGQNLGQYASMAKSAGGFAEFHGAASSRHLHVVPSIGPIGDRRVAVAAPVQAASGSTYNGGDISITIIESKDAKATAREVAREIAEIQRNERRRR